MCTFMSSLPRNSKSAGINKKKKNLALILRPCADEKTYYRFRLLAFHGINSDRDDPHICRYVHQIWGKHPEKGYPMVEDEIVCPSSPHAHKNGGEYMSCKVCDMANKYFSAYKESGKKDKESVKKGFEFSKKYQAIVPVYVVNDPNNDANNGKFKVLIFNDKKFYEEHFRPLIDRETMTHNVFNNKDAVDCCIHVAEVEHVRNEGQPNQYTYKSKELDKIKFSNKPYDLPSITKETIDEMGFDETYYVTSTQDDIEAFYKRWCVKSNDDIPDDDDNDVTVYSQPEKKAVVPMPKAEIRNAQAKSAPAIPDDDLDDLASDPDDAGLDVKVQTTAPADPGISTPSSTDDIDAEDLLAGLDI